MVSKEDKKKGKELLILDGYQHQVMTRFYPTSSQHDLVFVEISLKKQRQWAKFDKLFNVNEFLIKIFSTLSFTWYIYPEMFSHLLNCKIFFCRDPSSGIAGMLLS